MTSGGAASGASGPQQPPPPSSVGGGSQGGGFPVAARLDLISQAVRLLEEVRMVMPGLQALFAFQLIAVFNQRFALLTSAFQTVHVVSLLLTALAAMCTLSVAAFHRIAEPHKITVQFVNRGGALVTMGMVSSAAARPAVMREAAASLDTLPRSLAVSYVAPGCRYV